MDEGRKEKSLEPGHVYTEVDSLGEMSREVGIEYCDGGTGDGYGDGVDSDAWLRDINPEMIDAARQSIS